MKKFGVMLTIVMALFIVPCLAQAQVDIRISFPLPPPIVFSAPPLMVVLPETEVYVAPDYDQDIYFYQGFWWRPWRGRWYRSLNYDSGWEFYYGVPGWYGGVYPRWRDNYRSHMWGGQRWEPTGKAGTTQAVINRIGALLAATVRERRPVGTSEALDRRQKFYRFQ
jgi:hypothetical protein